MEGKRGVKWSQSIGEMKKKLTQLGVNHNNYLSSHRNDNESERVPG
jgi:hypothetical protein